MGKPRIRISQSLVKDYTDYKAKQLCGLLFDAKWISRTTSKDPTEAMMLGRWFEYLALGPWQSQAGHFFGMPAGELPGGFKAAGRKQADSWDDMLADPWKMKGEPGEETLAIQDSDIEAHWTAKYVNLWYQAKHLRATFEAYGIEILKVQEKIVQDQGGYDRVMVWDVLAMVNKLPNPSPGSLVLAGGEGEPVEEIDMGEYYPPHLAIIDVKATGLINDGWKPYGWDEAKLIFKDKIMLQPLDYMDQVQDLDMDPKPKVFYFYVASNTNQHERKLLRIDLGKGVLTEHRQKVLDLAWEINFEMQTGFEPYPSLEHCIDCPLRSTCEHKTDHPGLRIVQMI